MNGRRAWLRILTAGLILLAVSLVACGSQELNSAWRDREVAIDGVDDEWSGAVYYIDKENIAVGLLNDGSYLYICLATVDFRKVQQVIGSGLTVWFDPQGGKNKAFGINFPLGMQRPQWDRETEKRSMPLPGEDIASLDRLREMVEASASEMMILGPGKTQQRMMPVAGSQEIKVKLRYSGGKLVYELRVPLVRDAQHPDAIGLRERQLVGVGFETAEIDREMMRERMRDRMGRDTPPDIDGMEGGRMSGGAMRGGGIRGGRKQGGTPERMELWTRVELASQGPNEIE